MRLVLFCLAVVGAFVAADGASAGATPPVLEKVVMLSRHGVRSPLRSVAVLQSLTHRGWPAWPVGPGEMTEHGAKTLALMGTYLRGIYAGRGLLPTAPCPTTDAVQVWADVADHRTRQSGEILADRLSPDCGVPSRHAADGTIDPLFDATQTDACPVGLLAAGRALVAATRNEGEVLRPEDRAALVTLQGIIAPEGCEKWTGGVCLVPEADASGLKSASRLALGATIAEALYLEYVQGFAPSDLGWGKAADPATIAAIMPLHDRGLDIRRQTPVLAARRGAVLARTIVALLQGRPLPAGAPDLSPNAKVVMIAGHDSNLLYMAGLMGLDWRLPNQPSRTPPDATLAFEVWRDPATNERTVRTVIYAQTLDQLRNATPLDADHRPDVVSIVPEACADASEGRCGLAAFAADVDKRLKALCGG